MCQDENSGLLSFIEESPSCYHVIANMSARLGEAGYVRLYEEERWKLEKGGRYYVTRNGSAVIAFAVPDRKAEGFQIMASHSDSPTFKVKENPEIEAAGHFVKLNVEKYGGMLLAPWFDRPLSMAGRLLVRDGKTIRRVLADVGRDLVLIPSLAIHMNRKANEGHAYNPQADLQPLFGGGEAGGSFMEILGKSADVDSKDILGMDVFLYNRMKGSVWGAREEFISSPRLDDLQCAWCSLEALLESENDRHVMVHCVLDNEEVGSMTRQGAASTFLKDTLTRIGAGVGMSQEDYLRALAVSFMLSADNAHSIHPNYTDKADVGNRPYANGGVVLKYSANQKYTTDGATAAVFRAICEKAKVPCQCFTNRSDMEGGSTLGNISASQVAVHTVDVGLAQLAMHSPYETAGARDTAYFLRAVRAFYSSDIQIERDGLRYTVS